MGKEIVRISPIDIAQMNDDDLKKIASDGSECIIQIEDREGFLNSREYKRLIDAKRMYGPGLNFSKIAACVLGVSGVILMGLPKDIISNVGFAGIGCLAGAICAVMLYEYLSSANYVSEQVKSGSKSYGITFETVNPQSKSRIESDKRAIIAEMIAV